MFSSFLWFYFWVSMELSFQEFSFVYFLSKMATSNTFFSFRGFFFDLDIVITSYIFFSFLCFSWAWNVRFPLFEFPLFPLYGGPSNTLRGLSMFLLSLFVDLASWIEEARWNTILQFGNLSLLQLSVDRILKSKNDDDSFGSLLNIITQFSPFPKLFHYSVFPTFLLRFVKLRPGFRTV